MFPTKVQPPRVSASTLQRQRLIDRIHEHLDRRMTLVSAPAGYGKTTLLATFAREAEFPVCWLTLDQTDRDVSVFTQHVVAALQRHFPAVGQQALQASASREPTPAAVAAALVSEIDAHVHTFFVIVLDDYHELDDAEQVNQAVDLLLTYLPEQCRLIIASRTIPAHLRLSRLAAQGEVAGLGASELAFTVDEVAGFLRNYGHHAVSEEEAVRWQEASHGWAAALVLSQEAAAPLGADIASPRELFTFLSDEVMGSLPATAQQFLMQTSVLAPVTPAAANALLLRDDADTLLEELAGRLLFVQRAEGQPAAYTYHPLLRDYLLDRLRAEHPADFATLTARAGRLAEAAGDIDGAVSHYLSGGHYPQVAALVQAHGQTMMNQGRWVALRAWFEALPAAYWDGSAELLLLYGRVLQRTGDTDQAIRHAQRAAALARSAHDAGLSARALILVARILGQRGSFTEAEELAREALGILPLAESGLRAEAHEVRGLCLRHLGKTVAALAELHHARRHAQETGDLARQAAVARNLASVYLVSSELEQAEIHYRSAFALWQQLGDAALQAAALNGLGLVHSYRGDYAVALSHFQQAYQLASNARTHPQLEGLILWNLASDLRDLRRYGEALSSLEQAEERARQAGDTWLLSRVHAMQSECQRATGQLLEAERTATAAARWARHIKSPQALGVAEAALGAVALARSESDEAARRFGAAVKQLRRARATRDLARALLRGVLAEAACQRDGNADALARELASLAQEHELGLAMAVEGAEFPSELQAATERGVGGQWLLGVLRRSVEWLARSQPESPVRLQQAAPQPRLQAFAFGEARVLRDGAVVTSSQWGTAVARDMFFLLLLHPNGLRREQITAYLWPEAGKAQATSQFHSTLYRMRHALGLPPLPRPGNRYRLDPALEIWADVAEFEQALRAASNPDTPKERAVMLLEGAVTLYRGPFLEDCYGEWAEEPREKLRSRYIRALLALARAYEERGEHDRSLDCYERILQVDNSLEEVHTQVLRCYASRNEPALVREHYHRYAEWLARELGAAPSPRFTRAYRELVREDA